MTIKAALKDIATLHPEPLRKYLEQKKAVQPLLKKPTVTKARAQLLIHYPLCPENLAAFTRYQTLLKLRAYSDTTTNTYCKAFHYLLRLLGTLPVSS